MWGDSHGTWGISHITLSITLEGDSSKVGATCNEKGCYVEVGVIASHFFVGGLISHLQKILKSIVAWLITFTFIRNVFL